MREEIRDRGDMTLNQNLKVTLPKKQNKKGGIWFRVIWFRQARLGTTDD